MLEESELDRIQSKFDEQTQQRANSAAISCWHSWKGVLGIDQKSKSLSWSNTNKV